MDVIVKEGMLYLQGAKFGKKTWRKVWTVLFKPSSTGVGRLELCNICDSPMTDQKKAGRLKPPERKKDPGESSKGDFNRGNSLTMEENDLYSSWKTDTDLPPNIYKVTVQSTEASRRCKLSGDFLISPDSEAVMLLDVSSSCIIYRWPYRMLRKFGQVEGGFSIEAGRRCESGQGLFIFLSRQSPEIFQFISSQCLQKKSMMEQLNVHRRSLSDQSLVPLPKTTKQPATPPACTPADVSAASEDESANHYSTIEDSVKCNWSSLVRAPLSNSREAVGAESEGEDERCQSLEAEDVDNAVEDSIYYNLQRAVPLRMKDQFKPELEGSQCIYSCLNFGESSLNPPLQPSSSAFPPPPSCTLSYPLPKPRLQPPVSNSVRPGYNAVDNMKEIEEAISSSCNVTPTETPGSFKHRLAAIISKDLAKLQPPLPPGAGSLTFSQ
ncbi:docking protein 1 isoform X2 [Sphaeramia orbicularis]|uniref:docking protein 1 isoform X2 n=1 Tax=Sphaeramia orbicularis TaxID=375764 RepID=UPI00117C2A47|nr:docking protein 3 isoform X2 [Sphaeramia orbicularis]